MLTRKSALIIVLLTILVLSVGGCQSYTSSTEASDDALRLTLSTDKAVYEKGETINVTANSLMITEDDSKPTNHESIELSIISPDDHYWNFQHATSGASGATVAIIPGILEDDGSVSRSESFSTATLTSAWGEKAPSGAYTIRATAGNLETSIRIKIAS